MRRPRSQILLACVSGDRRSTGGPRACLTSTALCSTTTELRWWRWSSGLWELAGSTRGCCRPGLGLGRDRGTTLPGIPRSANSFSGSTPGPATTIWTGTTRASPAGSTGRQVPVGAVWTADECDKGPGARSRLAGIAVQRGRRARPRMRGSRRSEQRHDQTSAHEQAHGGRRCCRSSGCGGHACGDVGARTGGPVSDDLDQGESRPMGGWRHSRDHQGHDPPPRGRHPRGGPLRLHERHPDRPTHRTHGVGGPAREPPFRR